MNPPVKPGDKTDYARSIGYIGKRRVIVSDGRVISHGNQDWFMFCGACRRSTMQRRLNAIAPRGPHVTLHTVHCGYGYPLKVRASHPDEACNLINEASRTKHETQATR